MKTLTIILLTMVSLTVFAQTEKVIENAPANYLQALKSNNDGVVESAIFHSVKYKIFYPDQNTTELEKEIENLVEKGKTEAIRYKAFLANQFIQNSKLMSNIEKEDYKDGSEFFKMLSQELNDHVLATK